MKESQICNFTGYVGATFENVRDSHFTGSVKSVTVDTAMP